MILSIAAVATYAYQFTDNKDKPIQNTEPTISVSSIIERLKVKSLTDEKGLFNALYQSVNKNNLKKANDLEAYEIAKQNDYLVSYIGDVLVAYQYKGIKTYINANGEKRYIVFFSHRSAEYSGSLTDEGSSLDLFLLKQVGDEYELIAKTQKQGLVNGTPGAQAIDDVVFNHIINSEPLRIGPKYDGYIVNFLSGVSGGSVNSASIIVIDEQKGKIYNINPDNDSIELMRKQFGEGEPEFEFDSFYYLDKTKENNGIYNFEVFTEGNANIGILDKPKIRAYNVHRSYKFDGKIYKLDKEEPNKYSSNINTEGYESFFSTIDDGGYAPIPYESYIAALDGKLDNWINYAIRYYKPFSKTNDFYSWKIKGVKISNLNVLEIQRGVCSIDGSARCGWAGETIIILDSSVEHARNVLKEETSIDFRNLTAEQKDTYPELYPIKVNGVEKAALVFSGEGYEEY